MPLAVFAASALTLWVAHTVADHWVQTDWQARNKGRLDWVGRWACTAHVLGYVATQAAMLTVLALALGVGLPIGLTATGLAVSGVTHWIIDRRWTLKAAAETLGKGGFYNAGQPPCGHGGYVLDQSAHALLGVWAPALIIALGV